MMDTIINAPRHFRLYGAVLAMAALLAILLAATLAAGPTQAQVATDPDQLPRTGDNAEEYDEPYPCSEEAVPGPNTAGIIRDGYYAVFDAFWDYEVGHLSNNFCPPAVTVTTETHTDEEGDTTTVTVYNRSDANIHISETVFAIPDSYKVTVVDSRTHIANGNPSRRRHGGDLRSTLPIIPFLADANAVSAVTDDGQFADNTLWWVRLDDPGTERVDETSDLQIGFSTGLLDEADWYLGDDPPVQFEFSAVHILKDGTPQEAHVLGAHFFAFDQRARKRACGGIRGGATSKPPPKGNSQWRPASTGPCSSSSRNPACTWFRRKPRAMCGTPMTQRPRAATPMAGSRSAPA